MCLCLKEIYNWCGQSVIIIPHSLGIGWCELPHTETRTQRTVIMIEMNGLETSSTSVYERHVSSLSKRLLCSEEEREPQPIERDLLQDTRFQIGRAALYCGERERQFY